MAAREVEEMFSDILERVKALDPANARKWFENLKAESLDGGALVVGCPDRATAGFLKGS